VYKNKEKLLKLLNGYDFKFNLRNGKKIRFKLNRKRKVKVWPNIFIMARRTINNFFIVATDVSGKVLVLITAGASGFSGSARATDLAVEKCSDIFCVRLRKRCFKYNKMLGKKRGIFLKKRKKNERFFFRFFFRVFLLITKRFNKKFKIFYRRLWKNRIFFSGIRYYC
jgi:hypothetical protein